MTSSGISLEIKKNNNNQTKKPPHHFFVHKVRPVSPVFSGTSKHCALTADWMLFQTPSTALQGGTLQRLRSKSSWWQFFLIIFFSLHFFPFTQQLAQTIKSSCIPLFLFFLIQTRKRCYMRRIARHSGAILFTQILTHSCVTVLVILRSEDSTQTEATVWKLSLVWICTLLARRMCDNRWEHEACWS